jgi:hypothetical protein
MPNCQAGAGRKGGGPEKRLFLKTLQVAVYQGQTRLWPTRKNVLTGKKGLFLGVLEEKQGGCAFKKTFCFGFFLFFGILCMASR